MPAVKVLKADHAHSVTLDGVTGPVPRPVDIDQTRTGFRALRTLRIYQFASPAVVDGHAEHDEVYIVVLAGSIELVMRSEGWSGSGATLTLSAPAGGKPALCAAYLPMHAEYRLTPLGTADVAYARATPSTRLSPEVFSSTAQVAGGPIRILLDETRHAQRLRVRLLTIDAGQRAVVVQPLAEIGDVGETLLHCRTWPAHSAATILIDDGPTMLDSWDTIATAGGANPALRVAAGGSVLGLMVSAT